MQIKMTAKRQATFPKKLCDEMRLAPGHAVEIEPMTLNGRRVWVLSPPPEPPSMAWAGSLRRYAGTRPLSMAAIRKQIAEAIARGELD